MEGITGPQRRLNDELLAGIRQAQIDFAVVQHTAIVRAPMRTMTGRCVA